VLPPKFTLFNFFFGEHILLGGSFSSLLLRTKAIKEIGGLSEKFKTGDDEIRIRMALLFPTLFVNGFTSWARETPDSASLSLNRVTRIKEKYLMVNSIVSDFCNEFEVHQIDSNKILLNLDRALTKEIMRSAIIIDFAGLRDLFRLLNTNSIKNILTLKIFKKNGSDFLLRYTSKEPLIQKKIGNE
jgi:hypothetical protein